MKRKIRLELNDEDIKNALALYLKIKPEDIITYYISNFFTDRNSIEYNTNV